MRLNEISLPTFNRRHTDDQPIIGLQDREFSFQGEKPGPAPNSRWFVFADQEEYPRHEITVYANHDIYIVRSYETGEVFNPKNAETLLKTDDRNELDKFLSKYGISLGK